MGHPCTNKGNCSSNTLIFDGVECIEVLPANFNSVKLSLFENNTKKIQLFDCYEFHTSFYTILDPVFRYDKIS